MNDLTKFDQLQADLALFVQPIQALRVADKNSSDRASMTLREVKLWEKKVEEKRKELVGPLNEAVKRINEYAKKISAPILVAEGHIKQELLAWESVLEREREEMRKQEFSEKMRREARAEALIQKQAEETASFALNLPPDAAQRIQAKAEADAAKIELEAERAHIEAKKEIDRNTVGGIRKKWTFEITDHLLIPAAFLMPDEKAIRSAVTAGSREIPGVRIFQETSIVSR